MTDEELGDANQHVGNLTELMKIAAILSVPAMFETGIAPYEEAVIALLAIVALVLVMR